jgi:hypothetical protein
MTPEQARTRGLPLDYDVRPPRATHRLIQSLGIAWDAWPEEPPETSHGMVAWLDKDGQVIRTPGDNGAGRPKDKARTIDLRECDLVMTRSGRWATITEIYAYRANWLTTEEAAANKSEGFLYPLVRTSAE